ncbi:hypothetical protein C8N46_106290 [Kordia periserrulae]|uniref:Uncharacterized protein n=1 Tax=Kordia periserrulae TaxID=701523 RepID=A0A2T6BX44_9FLAO|nr:hypothetical protein C8N46_106290 [Kordia periserrulae]
MCEKCVSPNIQHLPDEKNIQPLQNKLKTKTLKKKAKKVTKA